jgi:hypothetical protein
MVRRPFASCPRAGDAEAVPTSDILGRLARRVRHILKEIGKNIGWGEKKATRLCAGHSHGLRPVRQRRERNLQRGRLPAREGDVLHFEDLYAMANSELYDAKSPAKTIPHYWQKEDEAGGKPEFDFISVGCLRFRTFLRLRNNQSANPDPQCPAKMSMCIL